ncbi:MAG: 5'/3'-nucleotidase SurE, partial [Abditibacteriaceae bacterium]
AFSLADWENPQWQAACDFCVELASKVLLMELPQDTFLNVNVPNLEPAKIKGIAVTSQGSRRYKGDIVKYEAPQVGTYYWRGGELVDRSENNDTDILAVRDGYISVTPLHVDLSNKDAMAAVRKVLL